MSLLPLTLNRAAPGDRMRDLGLLSVLVGWLLYTRVFWALRAAHVVMPPCPFFYLTGHPCPFCGGTRSFAYMWQGDIADAVRLYPLGPAFFAGSLLTAAGMAAACDLKPVACADPAGRKPQVASRRKKACILRLRW